MPRLCRAIVFAKQALILCEIEEETASPKKLIGDICNLLLADRIRIGGDNFSFEKSDFFLGVRTRKGGSRGIFGMSWTQKQGCYWLLTSAGPEAYLRLAYHSERPRIVQEKLESQMTGGLCPDCARRH